MESYTFLRIHPFLPIGPFYWHIVADSSLMILCISVLSAVISPFSFLILLIRFFSLLFLMSLANGLFIYLLKEPAFGFVEFCYSLLCFSFIYFCPNFYDFFPSTNPGVLLFLVALGVKLGYLFDFSPVS